MGPDQALPLPAEFTDVDAYVDSLLNFATSSWLLQTLCGGVHILDFFTRTEDLYSSLLSKEWRDWFQSRSMVDILDLFMREDLTQFDEQSSAGPDCIPSTSSAWRDGAPPPQGLLQYIKDVRAHLLDRRFPPPSSGLTVQKSSIARHVAVGMKVKKVHEVDNFSRYVDRLISYIASSGDREISHLVDFGSGQNYLGRALAAEPYSKHIVAVESKQHNIEGAKHMDVLAKLVDKPLIMRNKKEYRAGLLSSNDEGQKCDSDDCTSSPSTPSSNGSRSTTTAAEDNDEGKDVAEQKAATTTLQVYTEGQGSVQYVEHRISDGNLRPVVEQVIDTSRVQGAPVSSQPSVVAQLSDPQNLPKSTEPSLMVISLHSCGNLVHHGLRSLLLNPSVTAVAMVGCCYNLLTERLGPPTYKLPTLRASHPRLVSTSTAFDPHGFPMSERLVNYPLHTPDSAHDLNSNGGRGIRLNITSRMMAVQAPQNWGKEDSDLFFTRHFYRALLQRIFLDRGVVSAPVDDGDVVGGTASAAGHTSKVNWTPPNGFGPGIGPDGGTMPLTIGTLRRFCYENFVSYVRGALTKLTTPNSFCAVDPAFISEKMDGLTDENILDYEKRYSERKKELSVMWSLMAFSAGVVEAVIVVDRWLWLKEQKEVQHAWVEPVFDYKMSPRNLVVVGIKK
ncbi:uncharacterized protein BDZ99DRAFT_458240 [Mytilinidion resinicola]|uniref:Methyltransferase domain-containing protein n=1 Tax=Mytilinidion resinicola TaxID=574789 RepID=A0A6A6Z5H5_9PEZI|nr:uncharacterized protein BDZ99DRAFT_458240 [Mytilinidion resinicola]KAF2816362.1 hypothetical protein BDZ99DRAFT_458240 [Mytilinidion resinicola]